MDLWPSHTCAHIYVHINRNIYTQTTKTSLWRTPSSASPSWWHYGAWALGRGSSGLKGELSEVHGFTSAAPHFGIVAKPYCAQRNTPPRNMQLTPLLSPKLQQEGPEVRPFHVEWNPLSLTQCAQLEVRKQSQGPCGYQRLWRTLQASPPSLSFPGQEPQPGLPFSPRSVLLKGLHLSRFVVVFNGARSISSASRLWLWRNRDAHRKGPFWVITWVHEAPCLGVADRRCWMWLKETTRASSDV